jgi:hypothetical protein
MIFLAAMTMKLGTGKKVKEKTLCFAEQRTCNVLYHFSR